jgi:hypothetical protein
MATRIKLRRDTAANWTSINPILASGEPGYETNSIKYKIGDGVTDWNSLPYFSRAHDELTNLDYASAGHTGFASTAALTSTSGTLQTNIDANTALITTISGKLDDHDEMNNLDYASAGHTGFQAAGDYATNTDLATTSGTLQTQIDSQAEQSWATVTSTHTVTSGGQNIFTDSTGGAFTITMYDNPEEGQRSTFMDKGGYSTTNNVTISGGSEKLHGENQYLYLNEDYGSFTLVYGDANSGWMATTSPSFMTLDQA